MKILRCALTLIAPVFLISSQPGMAAAVDTDAVIDAVAKIAGIDFAEQHDKLLAGEIVTVASDGRFEIEKEEIAAAQIMYLPVKVADVAALLRENRFHERANRSQELKTADDQVIIVELDDKSAKKLKDSEPGDDVNFSAAEFKLIAASDDLAATLNSILTARYKSYRLSGLQGIAEYQRKKETINIAEYIEEAENAATVAPKYFPEFHAASLDYPSKGQSLQHRLFAVKNVVEGDPQYLLTHWIIDSENNYILVQQRHFYVNHTYDTLQMSLMCLPYHEGVLVTMLNETFTEKVAGFGSGMAHNIGRGRLADAIEESLEMIKAAVK